MQADLPADFLDAHERHWDDAERLFQSQRWANADHLYGIAAECGLKRLMVQFGMPVDSAAGAPTKPVDRKHADAMWARFESYRSGRTEGAEYVLPANPFSHWLVSDRYAHESHFDQARAEGHRTGAQAVRGLIAKARREGWLS